MHREIWTVWMATVLVLACGQGQSDAGSDVQDTIEREAATALADDAADGSGSAVSGAPAVGERYQQTIDRAWENALAGETPAYACAGLKGRLMGAEDPAADGGREALFACNVLAPARYFETLLDRVDSGEGTCQEVMTAFMTQLSAMTLSIESIQGMVDAMERDPQGGAVAALRLAVDEATMEKGLADPRALIKERLAGRVGATCPDLAPLMLR